MKKIARLKVFFVFLVLFGCLAGFFVGSFANSDVTYASVKDANIVYNSVHKDINIKSDKTMEITETIDLTFKRSEINVGLVRNISRINKITRIVDGKEYTSKVINGLSNVSVLYDGKKEYHFIEQDGEYYYINTGEDYDYKDQGDHTYVIKYTYDMGYDFIDEFDDFTFDIMDYGYLSKVGAFSATITLPKEFTNGKDLKDILTFRTNNMKEVSHQSVNLQVEGNVIKCSWAGIDGKGLSALRGLTIQLILPNGYFETSFVPNGLYIFLAVLCGISILVIAAIVIVNFTKRHVVITPEFYPPKGYNALEVARAYRGYVKSKDFASLIIEWAAKGYIAIKMVDNDQIFLRKLKDMPEPESENRALRKEKAYFDAMFKESDIYDASSTKYNPKLSKAVSDLYTSESKTKKTTNLLRFAIEVFAVLPMLFFLIWYNSTIELNVVVFFLLLFPLVALNVFLYVPMPIWFKLIWCGLFGGGPLFAIVSMTQFSYDIYGLLYIALVIFLLGSACGLLIRVFTEEELKIRGLILGFKQFLVTAELDKLEMMIAEDPEYYYNILPYCYVFGITKKMEEKFNALHVDPPSYCQGTSVVVFCSSLNRSMRIASLTAATRGGSGGHGGFGGGRGGSSGRGGGGGGMRGR